MHKWLLGACFVALMSLPAQARAITFAWDPVTKNADNTLAVVDGYNFWRSVDGGATFTKLLSTTSTVTTAADVTPPTGNVCYQVTAFNRMGESAASNRLCFQMPSARPSAPSNLRETP